MSCGRNHAEKGWSIVRGKKSSATMSVAAAREVSGMPGNKYHNGYREDEELYVYDQSCENCRFYCDWDDKEHNGCKNFSREDYEQYPRTHWCCDWKGKRGRR
jgi:hypothetical protein